MNIWLNVEIAPGANIETTCQEAIELAARLHVTVWFDFNEVKCCARPGDDWKLLVNNFYGVINSKSAYKIATANPSNP